MRRTGASERELPAFERELSAFGRELSAFGREPWTGATIGGERPCGPASLPSKA
jgi:hypothetical protein